MSMSVFPPPPLVSLRLAMRCNSLAAFVDRCWRLVRDDRILLVARRGHPAGTRLRFALTLSDGSEAVRGEGRVVETRRNPSGGHWLKVAFTPLDDASRRVVERLHSARAERKTHAKAEFDDDSPTTPIDRDALEFDEDRPTAPLHEIALTDADLEAVDVWRDVPTGDVARAE